jgi:hypothetical protein
MLVMPSTEKWLSLAYPYQELTAMGQSASPRRLKKRAAQAHAAPLLHARVSLDVPFRLLTNHHMRTAHPPKAASQQGRLNLTAM